MILCFELSMPGRGSWNGRWSGSDNLYAKVVNMGRSKKSAEKARKILEEGSFGYHWNDGWSASVNVREVDGNESRRIRRKTNGFCGYDWMVRSIIRNLEILI